MSFYYQMNPLVFAVPFYLGLILIEYTIARGKGKNVYTWNGTVGNLLCGIGHIFVESITQLPVLFLFAWVSRYSLNVQLAGWVKWVSLFVLIDFIYFIYHYLSHHVTWMWAVHGVHHQSEDYNFSVGLRQAWFHKLTAFWTPLPLAFLGFTLQDYILVLIIHSSLQIWTHTQLFQSRIPWLEWLFVTPSHHRVHHGTNPQYIDKNFAALISIWDYLFDTYEPEVEKVNYGIRGLKERVNPFISNLILFRSSPTSSISIDRNFKPQFADWMNPIFLSLLCIGYFMIEKKIDLTTKCGLVFTSLALIIHVGTEVEKNNRFYSSVP